MNDNEIKSILRKSKTIAMIGGALKKKERIEKILRENQQMLL